MAERPLIGLSPDQVSTNGMLGDLAFQDSDGAYIETIRGKVSLDKLDKEITDTAVDIFVYDTRKDSDGGAWRKRTQHTSWYNETLNTSTRGSRREFPAVAVIICGSDGSNGYVHIYDGDDPDLPMWMKFYSSPALLYTTPNAVSVLNGTILVALPTYGVVRYDFIGDTIGRWRANTTYDGYKSPRSIGKRSTAWAANVDGAPFNDALVNDNCNDVAMTVLPNAPIDSATGLPVPTIAVGTNDGVSVIKDDGIVISTTSSSGGYHIKKINFTEEYGLNAHIDSSSSSNKALVYVKNFESINGLTYASYANWDGVVYASRYQTNVLTYRTPSSGSAYPVSDFISMSERDGAIGSNFSEGGLTLLEKNNEDAGQGIVAFATTSYNTGWMHGDIKGAFLSDTDATNVTGSNLISNGDFTSNYAGWSGYAEGTYTTLSIDSGRLKVEQIAGTSAYGFQAITTVVGKTYVVTADFTAAPSPSAGRLLVGTTSIGGELYAEGYSSATRSVYATFTATTTTTYISAHSYASAGNYVLIDNVSVRIAEEDRSVNNKGLQVFGTVTKSAVATGAELVAYGFGGSNSNYLEQPYNSDLDFGTGDFSIMYWFYQSTTDNTYQDVLSRASSVDGSWTFQHQNTGVIWFYLRSGGGYNTVLTSDNSITTSSWTHVAVVRSGGKMNMYINGAIGDANGGNPSYEGASMTASGARLRINTRVDQSAWTIRDGNSIALVRLSASAPSPEQIKKIYEDEKVLFQDNAACTLYGSSDAVTALAYDDSSNILYAGTSSGRSDFQGLCRINNTTTAVTTAMSASNGLVAEQ